MTELKRFSTSGLRPRQRVEFWNELCSVHTPITTRPYDLSSFEPSCTRGLAGDLPLAEVCSSPSTVDHTSVQVARTREPFYFLYVQLEGTSVHRQGGRDAQLRPGDFTLLSSVRPYQNVFEKPNKVLVLAFAEELLERQVPSLQDLVAVRMCCQDNLVQMASRFAAGLWQECAGPGLAGIGGSLSSALLQLIGCAYTRVLQANPRGSRSFENRRFHILRYIESNLRDSQLGPVTIAARFKQSPRSLHMLFSKGPETLSRYILRRRLQECARALASPLQHARTISEVAFDHGFSSSAHFCKVFREHFDLTPTEYRQRCNTPAKSLESQSEP